VTAIALVGISGAGKSTVGHRLANRLTVPFADSDDMVEEHMGCSIAEAFADPDRGEGYFRAMEAAAIKAVLSRGGTMVLAVGGGAVCDRKTRHLLKNQAEVVWFQVPPDVAYWRTTLQPGVRPLLAGAKGMTRLRYLADERRPYYRSLADITVDAALPPDQVLSLLVKAVGR
jgi:shikimate kinase